MVEQSAKNLYLQKFYLCDIILYSGAKTMQEITYETKLSALTDIFHIEEIDQKWTSRKLTSRDFLRIISKDSYSLSETGLSASAVSKLLHKLFPDRYRTSGKVCSYLLRKFDLKYCLKCRHVYCRTCFHSNSSKTDGLNVYCIDCFNVSVRDMRKEYQASKRAGRLERTPSWANLSEIKEIYKNCPEGYHVDHIIPLQGALVSGLHVEYNLQYLLAKDNLKKSNKFTPA